MCKLESLIPIGKDNAIHLGELANRLNMNPAAVKKMIREARMKGIEICSSTCGYWIAIDSTESMQFVKSMRKQSLTRFMSTKAIRHNLKQMEGQQSLFDEDNTSDGGGNSEQK